MLDWVVIFLILAIIAAVLGFGGLAIVSANIAQAIFFIFVVLFVITLILTLINGRNNRL